ncbi:hypothetical protein JTE90_018783 [Oedothorax gibbosus]|uniref:Transmembrane protein n=1 Tax=Oedothorax gibbosus TaxID=931172 RepID=A0AAV6UAT2_9ARAC|nr:hypothetical protein JTE90_018783 [Oedothorax gibbosus]
MKRTNSVISSMYHPIGNSKIKTALCMFAGGLILVCLGVCLIVTTLSVSRPSAINDNETSVLISGPTCLALGTVIVVFSGNDMCRYRRAKNNVESELNSVISSLSKQSPRNSHADVVTLPTPKVSICLSIGTVIVVFSGNDMRHYRRAKNNVESELNSVIISLSKPSPRNSHADVSHCPLQKCP